MARLPLRTASCLELVGGVSRNLFHSNKPVVSLLIFTFSRLVRNSSSELLQSTKCILPITQSSLVIRENLSLRHHSAFTTKNHYFEPKHQAFFYSFIFRFTTWRLYKSMEHCKERNSIATSGSASSTSHGPSQRNTNRPKTTGRAFARKRRKAYHRSTGQIPKLCSYESSHKIFNHVRQASNLQRWQCGPVSWSADWI